VVRQWDPADEKGRYKKIFRQEGTPFLVINIGFKDVRGRIVTQEKWRNLVGGSRLQKEELGAYSVGFSFL